jgi:hypothetical protein
MKFWSLVWSATSGDDLLAVGHETAASVGRAVLRWTETGEGWTEPAGGDLLRVLAADGFALVAVDEANRRITVLRVLADDPLPVVAPLLDVPEDGDDD